MSGELLVAPLSARANATMLRAHTMPKPTSVLLMANRVGAKSFLHESNPDFTPMAPKTRDRSMLKSSHGHGVGMFVGG